MTTGNRQQLELLESLETSGDPALEGRAERLEELLQARQSAALSADVYDAAIQNGRAPHGWLRASEHPELLRAVLPDLGISADKLHDLLRPAESGFRAELYLPDPAVLGPDCKPTLAFKGSAGSVLDSEGRSRETSTEDFLGNNFPQSLGLRTDYYDRAMDVALELKRAGLDFDIVGHSLGGGMASAASAVTGMRAITFNAAGLHLETVARYAREAGGLPTYDTNRTVIAWQVGGDLLNDGVQGDLASLGALDRHRLAGLLSDTTAVLHKVPEARRMLETQLMAGMSESSHPAVREFLDRLEEGDGARLLRDLPQAAGIRKLPLPAMVPSPNGPVPREDAASIADLHRLAAPLLTTLSASARGASAGSTVGNVVAAAGRLGDQGLDFAGDNSRVALGQAGTFAAQGYRLVGVTVEHGTRAMGAAAAQWQEIRAEAEAGAHRAYGWVRERHADAVAGGTRMLGAAAGLASPQARRDLDAVAGLREARGQELSAQSLAEAAQVLQQGRASAATIRLVADLAATTVRDDFRQTGERVRAHLATAGTALDAGLEATGDGIAGVTARAPLSGAALGGTTGLLVGSAVAYRPGTPWTAYSVQGTVQLARQTGPAVHEALERHGMATAMIPSLDAEIARQEQAARALLLAQERERPGPVAPAARPLLLMGESGHALDRFLGALRSGDATRISAASSALLDTRQAHEWLEGGQKQLETQPWRPGPAAGQVHESVPDAMLAR